MDKAFQEKNGVVVRDCIRQIEKINKDFMKIAIKRYQEPINIYWA